MIGAFVSILSLNLTLSLVQNYGVVYRTLTISDVSATTPIVVTSAAHGIPLGRLIHGVVSEVTGTEEANGLWVLTPLDADTFSLSTFDAQGNVVTSAGVNAYTGGGQIQWAFPDGQILLGRRNKMLATMVATPRILFIPTRGQSWTFEAFGGASPSIVGPRATPRGSPEQESMTEQPQLATQLLTFEVFVNGSGPNYGDPLQPDFADFDATQALVHALYAELFDAVGGLPRAKILAESWPSQEEKQGTMTQRGQQWRGTLEVQMPVRKVPIPFVPVGVLGEIIVQPADPLDPEDLTVIDITP